MFTIIFGNLRVILGYAYASQQLQSLYLACLYFFCNNYFLDDDVNKTSLLKGGSGAKSELSEDVCNTLQPCRTSNESLTF